MIAESPLKPTTSLFAGDRMRGIALALFTAAGLWICFRLMLPFLPAIAWSLALAVAAVPMQRRLEARLARRNLAATIDNLLYPVLVGNRLRLHTAPALIAILGGVAVFGASGVILGPLAVAATASLLEIWRARTRDSGAEGVVGP